jgi:hypothetical protein
MVYKVEEIFQLVQELFNKLCSNILAMHYPILHKGRLMFLKN